MSTKNIRECIGYLRDIDFDRESLEAALAEVEAIEKAADAITQWQTCSLGSEMRDASKAAGPALDLLQSIAKETKR